MPPNNLMLNQQQQPMSGMQVPQLPPSLAMQLMQRAQMRANPQSNPLMNSLMQPPPQLPPQMPGFQPSQMPKPTDFWQQAYQPSDSMKQNAMAQAMPSEAGVGMPGQLPQGGTPQIPDSMQGMGFGANAPQTFNGTPPNAAQGFAAQYGGMPGTQSKPEDPSTGLRSQLFKTYLSLYPQGNL